MAQLAAPQQAKVGRELEHALQVWTHLPAVEIAFAGWPEDVALDFIFEWSLEEDRLRRLAAHAERGELTAHQQARYLQLLGTVKRHRPIVERLIDPQSDA